MGRWIEEKRRDGSDGIRSFVNKDTYQVAVYNPKMCTKKHFEKETGIRLGKQSKMVGKRVFFTVPNHKVYGEFAGTFMVGRIYKENRLTYSVEVEPDRDCYLSANIKKEDVMPVANFQIQYVQGANEFSFTTFAENLSQALNNFYDSAIEHERTTRFFEIDDEGNGHEVTLPINVIELN